MCIDNKMYNTDVLTATKTNYLGINTFTDIQMLKNLYLI